MIELVLNTSDNENNQNYFKTIKMIFFKTKYFFKDLSVCFFLTFQIDSTSSTMDIYVFIYVIISNLLKKDKMF